VDRKRPRWNGCTKNSRRSWRRTNTAKFEQDRLPAVVASHGPLAGENWCRRPRNFIVMEGPDPAIS
jgi:hypothetical protein